MFIPSTPRYKKQHKGRIHGNASVATTMAFGAYGLRALEPGRLTSSHLETCRLCVLRYLKRQGKFWIRAFPDVPVSSKPAEVRMGKGKGAVEYWAFRVKPGRIVFEVDGITEDAARSAFELVASRLPFRTAFVVRGSDFAF